MTLQYEAEASRRISPSVSGIWEWSQQGVDPAEAWDSLLRGEWVVVDHPASESARTVLSRSAAGHCAGGDALEPREVRIATRRARGDSIKVIAIDQGCSEAVIHRHIASVMRKLKVKNHADLVALLLEQSPWGLSASRVCSGGEDFLVLTYPTPFWALPPCLTRAEQGIVVELIGGASYCAIAMARGTAARTVANQIASIFRKLNVGSRIELFVALRPR
jgi:DNA-binding NarL/FixJ family response regulator